MEIFGTQTQKGKIIFMDAYPDYYSKSQSQVDWQNLNPIRFLRVENIKFDFFLISKEESLRYKTLTLLKGVLKALGIGAKTSPGY